MLVTVAYYHPVDAETEWLSFLVDPLGWIDIHFYFPHDLEDDDSIAVVIDEDAEPATVPRPYFNALKPCRVLPGAWEVPHRGPPL